MSSIVIQGDTSGSITVEAPSVAGTNTLTLPASTGTIATTADVSALTTGKILQVVQGTATSNTNTTSATYVDTNLSASITPSSTSSKVLVLVTQCGFMTTTGVPSAYTEIKFNIVRNSTTVAENRFEYRINGTGERTPILNAFNYLDSPSTTSSITYKTQMKSSNSDYTLYANWGGTSTILLVEIAG